MLSLCVFASINPSVLPEFSSWCSSAFIYINVPTLLFGRMIENWLYSLFINSMQGTFFAKFSPSISYEEQETMKLTVNTRIIFGLETEVQAN